MVEGNAGELGEGIARRGGEQHLQDLPADGPPPKIDQVYVPRAEPLIEEQLERAGVKLKGVLNRVLQ